MRILLLVCLSSLILILPAKVLAAPVPGETYCLRAVPLSEDRLSSDPSGTFIFATDSTPDTPFYETGYEGWYRYDGTGTTSPWMVYVINFDESLFFWQCVHVDSEDLYLNFSFEDTDGYPANGTWSNGTTEYTFTWHPCSEAIPTLDEWGRIILILVLIGTSVWWFRRRA